MNYGTCEPVPFRDRLSHTGIVVEKPAVLAPDVIYRFTMPLDPQQQQAISAHMQYLRDLGIYDFYRRDIPLEIAVAPEESLIPVRKPVPVQPPVGSFVAPPSRAEALRAIQYEIGDCTRCALSAGRNKIVFGDGDPNARLMFVGEGPGADEDAQGLPFVGRAGQLLNNMIAATGLKREQVYIANIVKCRPPQNRTPEPEEANTCSPFLFQQIDVVRPEVIVALGSTAATYLLGVKSSLSGLRGRVHTCRDTKLIITYHPAYLLRDPRQKKEAWQDLKLAMAELGLSVPSR
jgi:uracil-DNA glycosylase